jgi:hypothetical protein
MNSLGYLHPLAPEITFQISPPDYPFSPIEIFDYGLWMGRRLSAGSGEPSQRALRGEDG